MRKMTTILFAVVASLLVVSVAPAASMDTTAQTDGLVVGSQHSTDTDFQNAQELTNVSVTGSGESSSVQLDTGLIYDSHEDGDLSEYTKVNTDPSWSVETDSNATDGTEVLKGTMTNGNGGQLISTSGLSDYPSKGDTWRFNIRLTDSSTSGGVVFGIKDGSNNYQFRIEDGNSRIILYKQSSGSYTSLTSASVDVPVDETLKGEVAWYSNDTIQISLYAANGTKLATTKATDNEFANQGGLGWQIGGTGDNTVYYDYARSGIRAESGKYISEIHNVSNAAEAAINITQASNVSVNATVRTDGGTVLNQTDLTSTGNHTLDLASTSSDKLEVVLDVNVTGDNPAFELADESILFTNHAPSASNLSPPNGTELTTREPTFEVDVSDQEFSTAQGDSVTAELFVDGQSTYTETVSSNTTVSTTEVLTEGGEHEYYWQLTDEYGATTTTATKTVTVPSKLRIYDESNPTELVDNATVELQFYYDGEPETVVSKNTSDGTIDMTGLPADRSFVVVADAEGYLARRIFVPSLYETQSVYLLNQTQKHVSVEFSLEDYTGQYSQENTVLLIQRGLNESWETVQGDYFGATGSFPAQLRYNTRHRLILVNTETGERRNLGTETPQSNGEFVVEVRSDDEIVIQRGGANINVNPATRSLAAVNGSSVDVIVDNQTLDLSSWTTTVYYQNSTVNQTLFQQSYSGPSGGSVSPTFDLSNRSGGNVTVVVEYETVDGQTGSKTLVYSVRGQYDNKYSLLDTLLSFNTLVPDSNWGMLTTFLSVLFSAIITTMIGGAVRASTELLGLVAVMSLAGFAVIGWLGYSVVFATGVAWVSLTAVRRGI